MLSVQIQDSSQGVPGASIPVELDLFLPAEGWTEVGHGVTNAEGVIEHFGVNPPPGIYRLMFDIAAYFPDAFFPSITVTFEIRDQAERYRIALVLSSFGYTTYRVAV